MVSGKSTSGGNRQRPHEAFAEKIAAMLAEGVAPWQKSWKAGEYHVPFNPVSGTVYRGVNRLILSSPSSSIIGYGMVLQRYHILLEYSKIQRVAISCDIIQFSAMK